jgi:hypothetical protein
MVVEMKIRHSTETGKLKFFKTAVYHTSTDAGCCCSDEQGLNN